ncbi:Cytochrome P450 CYP2 subfamily [Handroanthus impetiginosus]|uniref:Cytochrome P450 CYP2 subfamily n=1 Tax=Handroanthus impetiginosus TaxID=429701 RepID=A0A2G9H358_9LAMI|nr:Cytochrome P450 CYP2 subfamily [Handroanthus impetiginosus]
MSFLSNLSLISILMFIVIKWIRRRVSLKIPPGPYSWPMIGNFLQIGKDPHIKLTSMARTYGPIMSLKLGSWLVVVGHISYTHPASSPNLNRYWVGFAKECNDQWKYLRSICRAKLFSSKVLDCQAKIRETNVIKMMNYLHAREGKIVNMSEVTSNVVLNTMSEILFSRGIFKLGPEFQRLIRKFLDLLVTPNMADLFPIMQGWDIQGMQKKVREINEKIFKMWEQILVERREKKRKGIRAQVDFLDTLLDIGLGTDMTSTTIIWALADLIKNKHIMSKLRDELTSKIGYNKIISEYEITNLPLHPPLPLLLPHKAIKTCKVMDYTIPKGSQVIINMWAMAHNSSIWDDPSSFKPERFLDSGVDFKGNDFEYIPFGSGRRMCPGLPMAARKVPYVVACLVHSFNGFLPGYKDPSEMDMDEVYVLALKMKQPLELIPKSL